jgi:hypothetical protein
MVRSSGHCRPRSASSCVRPVWIRGVVLGFVVAACLQICGAQSTGAPEAIVEAPEYLKQTDHCCQVPVFGNENIAPELYECKGICEAMVPYTTPQACTMNHTCIFALAAYNAAYDLALTRLSEARVCDTDQRVCGPGVGCLGGTCRNPPNDMSVSCELTLRRAVRDFPLSFFARACIMTRNGWRRALSVPLTHRAGGRLADVRVPLPALRV